MEIRELQAFAAAAEELHFARAAERVYMSASTMSETMRKLESELGTPLFLRSTRRVELTAAGRELQSRAIEILGLVDQAADAVRGIGHGSAGRIIVGVTPPAAPVLAPHLTARFSAANPEVDVTIERLWLPNLGPALAERIIDIAVTCGQLPAGSGRIETVALGGEPLLVGLREGGELAQRASLRLADLEAHTLGVASRHLFPAWHQAQLEVLARENLTPPTVELADSDIAARRWTAQPEVDWIMLTGSLLAGHERTVVRPVNCAVPFTISWRADVSADSLTRRFVRASLDGGLPDGWV
jgi:DNA-binding transcriptional LysR family regulator